jgi:hypothetical protein
MHNSDKKNNDTCSIGRSNDVLSICQNKIKFIFSTVLLITQCGCAILHPVVDKTEYLYFPVSAAERRVILQPTVEIIIENNIHEICSKMVGEIDTRKVYFACSKWNPKTSMCFIHIPKDMSSVILGHELRHCFEGSFH